MQAAPAIPVHKYHGDHEKEHLLPIRTYLTIYGTLLFLTLVTIGVSILNLGPKAIYIAMLVAIIKAALVAGYFMHLKYDARFNTFVFLSALLFLIIFAGLTMVDMGTRDDVLAQEGNFVLKRDQAWAKARLMATAKASGAGPSAPPSVPAGSASAVAPHLSASTEPASSMAGASYASGSAIPMPPAAVSAMVPSASSPSPP